MIYIDNAATTRFKPFGARMAAIKEMRNSANPGRSSHSASLRSALIVEECRAKITECFYDGNVIFTKNCTEALNLAILGSEPTGQVITTAFEHNSVLRPLKFLSDSGKIKLTVIAPDKSGNIEATLLSLLKRPTSLVVLNGMNNTTGRIQDIGALSKKIKSVSNAKILIDMAQAAGHAKFDYSAVDMCAFAGHKSLHGLQGTGFLLAKPDIKLKARILGGTGTSSLDIEHPNDIPDGMEAGTLNTVGIAALREAIDWTNKNFDKINAKIDKLTKTLFDGFKEIPRLKIYAAEHGILLCNFLNTDCVGVADILNAEYGICVRSGLHCAPLAHKELGTLPCGAIRFGIGYNNTVSDIEKCVEAMEEISNKL